MPVELGIIQKVKVGFLLVGHTHDHIDQMFIHFAVTLGRKNFGSLPSLTKMIINTYSPYHILLTLEETINMQIFIMGLHGEERRIEKINGISFQHQFCIKKIDGKELLWGKKYSASVYWGPALGLTVLKFISIHQIYASKLLLL